MSVRHPLTQRERRWLVAQLRTVRGRGPRPGDQVAIDTAAIAAAGEEPATRIVEVEGLAEEVAGELAAVVLGLPPSRPAPGPGTHRVARAGGGVEVEITAD